MARYQQWQIEWKQHNNNNKTTAKYWTNGTSIWLEIRLKILLIWFYTGRWLYSNWQSILAIHTVYMRYSGQAGEFPQSFFRRVRFVSFLYSTLRTIFFFPFPILIQTPRVANECANAHKLRFSHVLSYKTYYDIEYIRNIQMNNTHAMWTIREINFKRFLTHTSTRPIRETLIEFHAYDGICMCF